MSKNNREIPRYNGNPNEQASYNLSNAPKKLAKGLGKVFSYGLYGVFAIGGIATAVLLVAILIAAALGGGNG